jgi:hypothetical protein
MMREFIVGGVLIAPFALYALEAAVLVLLLRPLLRKTGVEDAFSNPPLFTLCIYVSLLATLVILQ